jgi:CPA2 family monovalent cation:H+ antiporter-2
VRRIQDVRDNRYALMRSVFRGRDAMPIDETHAFREQLYSVELTGKSAAVGKRIGELGLDEFDVTVTAVRRDGIVGKDPDPDMELRDGDFLVLYGIPEALGQAEDRVLKG